MGKYQVSFAFLNYFWLAWVMLFSDFCDCVFEETDGCSICCRMQGGVFKADIIEFKRLPSRSNQ
jgi:hypothetical protein